MSYPDSYNDEATARIQNSRDFFLNKSKLASPSYAPSATSKSAYEQAVEEEAATNHVNLLQQHSSPNSSLLPKNSISQQISTPSHVNLNYQDSSNPSSNNSQYSVKSLNTKQSHSPLTMSNHLDSRTLPVLNQHTTHPPHAYNTRTQEHESQHSHSNSASNSYEIHSHLNKNFITDDDIANEEKMELQLQQMTLNSNQTASEPQTFHHTLQSNKTQSPSHNSQSHRYPHIRQDETPLEAAISDFIDLKNNLLINTSPHNLYYFENYDRHKAEFILESHGLQSGQFLIRKSQNVEPTYYVLTIVSKDEHIHHFKIVKSNPVNNPGIFYSLDSDRTKMADSVSSDNQHTNMLAQMHKGLFTGIDSLVDFYKSPDKIFVGFQLSKPPPNGVALPLELLVEGGERPKTLASK